MQVLKHPELSILERAASVQACSGFEQLLQLILIKDWKEHIPCLSVKAGIHAGSSPRLLTHEMQCKIGELIAEVVRVDLSNAVHHMGDASLLQLLPRPCDYITAKKNARCDLRAQALELCKLISPRLELGGRARIMRRERAQIERLQAWMQYTIRQPHENYASMSGAAVLP